MRGNLWEKAKGLLSNKTAKNVYIVAVITIALKIVGFFKETIIASTYGLSDFLDAFFIALLIPAFIQNVFITSFKNIFIPNYIIEKKNNGDIGNFQALTLISTLSIIVLSVVFTYLISDFFVEKVYPGHDKSFYDLIKIQLNYLLPCLLFWGLSSFLSGLLEIRGKFLLSSISGFFAPIMILICIFWFNSVLGASVLAVGTLLGSALGFIYLLIVCMQQGDVQIGKPRLSDNSKLMLKQLPPKVSSGFLSGMNDFVDQYFAAQLAIGAISAINYGQKIPSFILGFSMIALGNVLLPYFSERITQNVLGTYKNLFKILKGTFLAGILFTGLIYLFSYDIIEFLFEKDEFTAEDTLLVSKIQRILLIYIPFYLCGNILVKFLTSINKNSFMAWQSFYKLLANIILNIILVKKYGIYGLALSTTIVISINSIIYLIFTYKQYKKTKLADESA